MSTNAKPGIGAKLNYWDDSSSIGVWVKFVEVTALAWVGPTREVIEVFVLDNSDDYMNKLQGIQNSNTVTATINYTKNQFAALKAQMETRGNKNYQIVLPDGEGIEWEGFLTELPMDIGSDDVMQGEITIEIDGKADFVSVASTSAT